MEEETKEPTLEWAIMFQTVLREIWCDEHGCDKNFTVTGGYKDEKAV